MIAASKSYKALSLGGSLLGSGGPLILVLVLSLLATLGMGFLILPPFSFQILGMVVFGTGVVGLLRKSSAVKGRGVGVLVYSLATLLFVFQGHWTYAVWYVGVLLVFLSGDWRLQNILRFVGRWGTLLVLISLVYFFLGYQEGGAPDHRLFRGVRMSFLRQATPAYLDVICGFSLALYCLNWLNFPLRERMMAIPVNILGLLYMGSMTPCLAAGLSFLFMNVKSITVFFCGLSLFPLLPFSLRSLDNLLFGIYEIEARNLTFGFVNDQLSNRFMIWTAAVEELLSGTPWQILFGRPKPSVIYILNRGIETTHFHNVLLTWIDQIGLVGAFLLSFVVFRAGRRSSVSIRWVLLFIFFASFSNSYTLSYVSPLLFVVFWGLCILLNASRRADPSMGDEW